MSKINQIAKDFYSNIAKNSLNKTTAAGRFSFDEGKEIFIINDIIQKLNLTKGLSLFDIGCGYGYVTEMLLKYADENKIELTLMDTEAVISSVYKDIIVKNKTKANLINGYFPTEYLFDQNLRFDRILLYSVLHYTFDPILLIEKAIEILKPNGMLMLGDLPNISLKGRFLSSSSGKRFEKKYKNVKKLEKTYINHHEFVKDVKNNSNLYSLIDDELINTIFNQYSQKGYSVYILPQNSNLPFCHTRLDILIKKYD